MYRTSSREESMLKSPSRMLSYTIGTTIRNEISIESLSDETHSSANIMNEATGTVRIILKGSDMKSLAIRSRYETAERISPLKRARKKPASMFSLSLKQTARKFCLRTADKGMTRLKEDREEKVPGQLFLLQLSRWQSTVIWRQSAIKAVLFLIIFFKYMRCDLIHADCHS